MMFERDRFIGPSVHASTGIVGTSLLALALLAGCQSSVVGGECRLDLTQCGDVCVDLDDDPRHCGACNNSCDSAQSCYLGRCVADWGPDVDGSTSDGDAGAGDAAPTDAGPVDAGLADGGDASVPDGGDGCALGERRCGDVCTRPESDPTHCGGCGVSCADGEVCAAGACEDVCAAPRMVCDDRCVDARRDPDNCGGCGISCPSGVCTGSTCSARVAGHVVVVGHDYSVSRRGMNQIAGNAVFLSRRSPARVVAYEGGARLESIAGTDAAIEQVATDTGRSWTRTVAAAREDVPLLLADADVFVLYAQTLASDAALFELSKEWGRALTTFLEAGGVVVVFDGWGDNDGAHSVLSHAGILRSSGIEDATGRLLDVVSPGDAVALGAPLRYRGERSTVRVLTEAGTTVVEDTRGPVVVHHTIVPE